MKITIDRAALLKPLGHVQSVVERRNTIPILSNVLLKAADDLRTLINNIDASERADVSSSVTALDAIAAGDTADPARDLDVKCEGEAD